MLIVLNHEANITLWWKFLPHPHASPPGFLSSLGASGYWNHQLLHLFRRAKSSPVSTSTEPRALEGRAQARKTLSALLKAQVSNIGMETSPPRWRSDSCGGFYEQQKKERRREEASKLNDKIEAGSARAFPPVRGAMEWFHTPL